MILIRSTATLALPLLAIAHATSAFASETTAPAELREADAPSRGTANVSPEVARTAAAISRQTMSPFCPGRTLSDCPSEYATQWRKDIRAMVAQGMSASEIQKVLESRVGENLSGSPHRNAGYGVSIGLALGAALVLFFVLARLKQNSQNEKGFTAEPKLSAEPKTATGSKQGAGTPAAVEPEVAGTKAAAPDHGQPSAVDDARLQQELDLAEGDDD